MHDFNWNIFIHLLVQTNIQWWLLVWTMLSLGLKVEMDVRLICFYVYAAHNLLAFHCQFSMMTSWHNMLLTLLSLLSFLSRWAKCWTQESSSWSFETPWHPCIGHRDGHWIQLCWHLKNTPLHMIFFFITKWQSISFCGKSNTKLLPYPVHCLKLNISLWIFVKPTTNRDTETNHWRWCYLFIAINCIYPPYYTHTTRVRWSRLMLNLIFTQIILWLIPICYHSGTVLVAIS